jgi:acetolactate synthase-1/2/3 large subunit
MSLPFTGYAPEMFAPEAKKIVVDVDEPMLKHSQVKIDLPIKADAKQFLIELNKRLTTSLGSDSWVAKYTHWKQEYGGNRKDYPNGNDYVNSYYFIDYLFEKLPADAVVVLDQGAAFYGPTQIAKVKAGQRLFTNGGIAPMGYGLPAALGACMAAGREVICIHGDGGLQLNIHELQTMVHYKMPVKLFVFNNQGYLSIKHTMKRFFGKYVACDPLSGVSIPDTGKIATAYGLPFERISNQQELETKLPIILASSGPKIIEIIMDPTQEYKPKVQSEKQADGTMVSKPLSDMYPYLNREEYEKEMEQVKDGVGKDLGGW